MEVEQIKQEIERIEREISVLQWDKTRNQLNPGKEFYLKKIVEKRDSLLLELKSKIEGYKRINLCYNCNKKFKSSKEQSICAKCEKKLGKNNKKLS